MGLKCAIVGLPNVGKSTLFNALSQANVEAANYPFCTIKPNIGVVTINDKRLEQLAKIVNPKKILAATVEFVDVAGLVKGASKGEGLGNQFLSAIREADAILHVVRCFENDNIIHVFDKISPQHDIEIINTELALADLSVVEKLTQKVVKDTKANKKETLPLKNLLKKILPTLEKGQNINSLPFDEQEQKLLKTLQLITTKPVLYAANINEDGFSNNLHLDTVKNIASKENNKVISICADIENEINGLNPQEKKDFLSMLGQTKTGLDRLINAGYSLLGLQTYFTAGTKEVRAWTIKIGANAYQAAGKIHSDFQKGFIKAETIAFADFIEYNGEKNAKEAGKLRAEGKDYIVKDGDIMHFLFNV